LDLEHLFSSRYLSYHYFEFTKANLYEDVLFKFLELKFCDEEKNFKNVNELIFQLINKLLDFILLKISKVLNNFYFSKSEFHDFLENDDLMSLNEVGVVSI